MSDDPVIVLLNAINDRPGRVEQSQTALRVDLMERMDWLGDQIVSVREDITVDMGAADSVRMANDGTKAELRALGEWPLR